MQATQIRKAVAAEVRAALGRDGRTDAQLAEAVGISKAAMSRKLRGINAFYAEELLAIAHALNADAGQFVAVSVEAVPVESEPSAA